jgi:signal transduction histidine kinase
MDQWLAAGSSSCHSSASPASIASLFISLLSRPRPPLVTIMNCPANLQRLCEPVHEARYNLTPVRTLGHKSGSGLGMEKWERLLDELHRELFLRERELDLLHAIDLQLLEPELSSRDIFNFIVQSTKKLLQASHTTILLRRSTFLEPMYSSSRSIVGQKVSISESLTGLSLETDALINVPDLTVSELNTRYLPLRGYRGSGMRSLLATPIRIRDTIVGVLNAESRHVNAFKTVHERIMRAIAAQVAIALQRTQTLASTLLLADVDRLMFANDSQNAVQYSEYAIQTALEKVMTGLKRLEHVQHTGAQIMFVRGEDELEIVHSTNPLDVGLTASIGKSVCGRAVRERRTIIVGDVNVDRDYVRRLGDSIRSEIAVPILFGEEDLVIGVLNVESDELDAFYGFYQVVLESFAEKVRTLLAFAKLRADVTEALELRSADDLLLAIGDQTSHMIHRLNNMVGAMRVRIMELQDMQSDRSLDNDSLRESLGALRDLAERTLKMPDEITLQWDGEGTSVDVNECVRKAINQIQVPEGTFVELILADGIPRLTLYCFDIVVQNLLQNGLDAMPKGGRLSISTSMVFDKAILTGYLQLSISDTGNGIPLNVQKRMFELNYSTKREKGKGLGLGLWWVRNFVRRARGDIIIRSMIGSGTEVTVKIPISRSTATS